MKSYLENTRSVRKAVSNPLHLTPSSTPEIGVGTSRKTLKLVPTSDDRVDIIVVDNDDEIEEDKNYNDM